MHIFIFLQGRAAIQASRQEILEAFQGLPIPAYGQGKFLDYVPFVDESSNSVTCPLFRVRNGTLEQRAVYPDYRSSIESVRPAGEFFVIICSFMFLYDCSLFFSDRTLLYFIDYYFFAGVLVFIPFPVFFIIFPFFFHYFSQAGLRTCHLLSLWIQACLTASPV